MSVFHFSYDLYFLLSTFHMIIKSALKHFVANLEYKVDPASASAKLNDSI